MAEEPQAIKKLREVVELLRSMRAVPKPIKVSEEKKKSESEKK